MKIYAKVRSSEYNINLFHSPNISCAVYGFKEMGFEIIPYELISEIYDLVTDEDIVLDYIDQVNTIFSKFNIFSYLPDYPEVLSPFLGRKIWMDKINSINKNPNKWGIFCKPVKDKVFTGRVINNTRDLIGCGSCYENYDVYCSEVLDIKREWRGFIYYDNLIDLRPYTGDWHYNYDSKVIDLCIDSFKSWNERPVACSIDFAVTSDSKTIFLEMNDCYALGNYGLRNLDYAKMISARWSQLFGRRDECKF